VSRDSDSCWSNDLSRSYRAASCRPRSGSATITGTIGKLVVRALFSIHQLTGRPIDCIFKLVSAGLARPHVSNALIGKMLRPLGCDQNRTALRALIPCCCFHWPLLTRYPIWVRHPKSRDGGRIKTVLRRLRDLTLPKKRFDFPSHGARLFSHLYALGRCSENVRRNPQQSITNYLAPIARRNRIEIMTTPTSGGSGDGVRSGPGSRGTRTGPNFIVLSLSTTERLLLKPK
jgi:hypothetical protein